NYSVTVTDSNGCIATNSVSISTLPGMSLSFSTTPASCTTICDGSAIVTPSGGTAPYTYLWNDGQINSTATGLCPAMYYVTITDVGGWIATDTIEITEPAQALTISSTGFINETDWLVADGMAWITVTGGAPPYTIQWNDTAHQTGDTAFNLPAREYWAVVIDDNNCAITSKIITVLGILDAENGASPISVFPNPFNGGTRISFNMNRSAAFNLNVVDLQGKEVRSIHRSDDVMSKGQYNYDLSAEELGSGMYFLIFESEEALITEKIVILK
ncbi:MAG: T9SS type A sorting domain-containing protein, partial [Bacteroidetes bacterium]|nr:T9SS type A sorting domain-containing protein [Bacteroidota bacterium]